MIHLLFLYTGSSPSFNLLKWLFRAALTPHTTDRSDKLKFAPVGGGDEATQKNKNTL